MVQKLKASLPSSMDDFGASAFVPPLPPRVSSRSSGSGMALRPSSRSRSWLAAPPHLDFSASALFFAGFSASVLSFSIDCLGIACLLWVLVRVLIFVLFLL